MRSRRLAQNVKNCGTYVAPFLHGGLLQTINLAAFKVHVYAVASTPCSSATWGCSTFQGLFWTSAWLGRRSMSILYCVVGITATKKPSLEHFRPPRRQASNRPNCRVSLSFAAPQALARKTMLLPPRGGLDTNMRDF